MDFFTSDAVIMGALMLLGVFSLRHLIEADIRAARARRKALKGLARSLGGSYEKVSRTAMAGERVRFERHGMRFLAYFEVVMAADDPSSYTRVQLQKADPSRSFPSVIIVPEDFLERADNLLFGREDRHLGDAELDERVIVRAEPGPDLEAVKDRAVVEGLRAFLDAGPWADDFLLESVPDLLRVSLNHHLETAEQLEGFVLAAADLLAAFPTFPADGA